ncbi:band 7 protein AGAP004871-like isoform X1 [Daphnia pulex]|uniref:band 7 protein AGAP004871-like isoform X1 n=2 Tax=Daphnia pulex TaxID=6669 RepID=UPI001EDFDB87|nr:band 7 protein AGAP004871-like isoform X1 [Daphnia pulex]
MSTKEEMAEIDQMEAGSNQPSVAPVGYNINRAKGASTMGVQTVEVSSASRPGAGSLMSPAPALGVATGTNDVEKGATVQKSGDQWGKNMQRWRNDNIDIGKADPGGPGICAFILTLFSFLLILATFPLSLCFSVKVVQEYERAVIFRLGRLLKGGARGPGIFFIVPCIDTYRKIDLRTVSFDVPPQEILSRDSVTVAVDAVVYYRVHNPTIAVSNVENFSHSTRLLAATTLRNVLGTKNLAEVLSERETISHTMQSSLDEATDPWGVKVERVEIKDVRLPVQLQRAMAAEAEAAREARAKVIAAEGEQKASHALREAAEIISESPGALQLRYLQTLNTISAEKNSTIIFPLPIDILKHFIKPDKKDKK